MGITEIVHATELPDFALGLREQPRTRPVDKRGMYTDDLSITLWLWALSRAPADALIHVLDTLPSSYAPRARG